jgi:RimJ/RimL family protein N-acetyltransferase
MFARTERLLLRPGWAEDAPARARAIADEAIVRHLATAPWPYGEAEAEAFLSAPRLVGACGFARRPSGAVELGYWIARRHWNRGFATEAGVALIEIARTLGLDRLEASHFLDNPASGRVLEKLGFVATGLTAHHFSCARNGEAPTRLFRLLLAASEDSIAA